jgi:hypothetical protein
MPGQNLHIPDFADDGVLLAVEPPAASRGTIRLLARGLGAGAVLPGRLYRVRGDAAGSVGVRRRPGGGTTGADLARDLGGAGPAGAGGGGGVAVAEVPAGRVRARLCRVVGSAHTGQARDGGLQEPRACPVAPGRRRAGPVGSEPDSYPERTSPGAKWSLLLPGQMSRNEVLRATQRCRYGLGTCWLRETETAWLRRPGTRRG